MNLSKLNLKEVYLLVKRLRNLLRKLVHDGLVLKKDEDLLRNNL
jgi:hypothetical protein